MSLFDLFINFFEISIICLALHNHFTLKKIELLILFVLMIIPLNLSFFSDVINDFSIIIIINIIILCLFFMKKIKNFENIIFCIFIIICDILCNFIALYFTSWLFGIEISLIGEYTGILYFATISSKLIFLIFVLLFSGIRSHFDGSLEFKKWWVISIVFVILVLILCVLGEALIFNNITNEHILFTIVAIILIFFFLVILYYRIQEENNELIKILIQNERQKYIEKNYQIINRLSTQISESEHRMMYILMQVKSLINNNNFEKANLVIKDYIDHINKFSVFINTNNPYFDFIVNRKFNECFSKGFICKANIFVSNEYVLEYDDLSTIVCLILDYFTTLTDADKVINVEIQQENNLIVFSFSQLQFSNVTETIKLPEEFYQIVNKRNIVYVIKTTNNILQIKFVWDA